MKKIFFTLFLVLSVCLFARAQNADFNTNGEKYFGPSISGDYLTTAVWGTFATSPHAMSRSCCAAIKRGDTIFVYQFGGGAAGAQQTNVARYNKLTGVWTNNVAVMPFNMSAGSAVTMPGDSLIYVIGGTNSPAIYGKCLKYNIITNTFTPMADMTPNPCTDQLSVRYRDSLIFCVGGGDGLFGTTLQYNSVRIYNTKSNSWSSSTNLPTALSMSGGGIYGDTIIVTCGASLGSYVATSYKGIINPSTLAVTWTSIPVYPGGAVTRMASYFVKVGGGGGILCTGGAVGGATITSSTYLWNFCTQSWQTLGNNTLARSNYKGCGFGDSVVYCVSGYTTVGTGQCDKITFSQIDGSCLVTSIGGNESYPTDYSLSQNYPNPFNPTTKIDYSISRAGLVTLKIYDILGQEIATLVNEMKSAGNHTIDLDASNLSSGVYFYEMKSGDFTSVKRMTLIK